MFTRCSACSTVHPVNAALLARDAGRYRCGKCQAQGNALDALFDDWPAAGQKPPPRGDQPVLGTTIDLEEASRTRQAPDGSGLDPEDVTLSRSPRRVTTWLLRAAWMIGGLVLGTIVIVKAAEWSGHPVLHADEIAAWKVRLGLTDAPPLEPARALDRIHLVSRKLAVDPTRPGVLRLEATLVNRASRPQPYPSLEVVLFDAAGLRISEQSFVPGDYLAAGSSADAKMSPHAYLPLVLELDDPGVQAVGFELNFY